MTAALEPQTPQSTILDIHPYYSTVHATPPPSLRARPIHGLPFRASADPNSTHAALSAYLGSFGFLCLLLFAFVNMRVLPSPALSTEAGERAEDIFVFCCYSLCLMLVLLFFAHYFHCVMSGGMLRAKPVRDSDRVLLDAEWMDAQQAHQLRYEQSTAVSVWSIVRNDRTARIVLTVLMSAYCCVWLVDRAVRASVPEMVVLVAASSALMTAAALTNDLLACSIAFVLSDWLQPLLSISLLDCPTVHSLSDGLLLAACQSLLCVLVYVAARASTRLSTLLLFSFTVHFPLLLVSPTSATLLTFLSCVLCSLPLHRLSLHPQPTAAVAVSSDEEADEDADISEELWRVKQFVWMSAVYGVASNGWRSVHCLLGDGLVQDVMWLAVLLLVGVREYKLRERHKQP